MRAIQILKRTAGTTLAATLIANPEHNKTTPLCHKQIAFVCKPSDLPIYPVNCIACDNDKVTNAPPREESELEKAIGLFLNEVQSLNAEIKGVQTRSWEFIETGIAHTSSSIDFLREETNEPERFAAIGISALSGYILGLRGGLFKRLLYATAGGTAMASVCFPREAADYADLALKESGRYFAAGYHFVFGELPKMPEWLDSFISKQSSGPKEDSEKRK